MSADDFAKILLAIAFTISIIGLSYQTMRLIGGLADSIIDLRAVLKSLGLISEKLVEDYDYLSEKIKKSVDSISKFTTGVVDPLNKILDFLKGITIKRGSDKKNSDNPKSSESIE